MVAKIELSSPDIDRVTVHLDGTFVATMWAFDEENGIPMELFHLMRAAPDLLAALKGMLEKFGSTVEPGESGADAVEAAVIAIQKAEGRTA